MKATFLFIIENLLLPVKKTWYTKTEDNKARTLECYKSEKDDNGKDKQLPFDSNSEFFRTFVCREIRTTLLESKGEHDSVRNRITPLVRGEASKHCRAFGKIAPLMDSVGSIFTSQTAKICSFVATSSVFECFDEGINQYRSDFDEIKKSADKAAFQKINSKNLSALAWVFNDRCKEIKKRLGFEGEADENNICELLACTVILSVLDGQYLSSNKPVFFDDSEKRRVENELCELLKSSTQDVIRQKPSETEPSHILKTRTSGCSQVFFGRDALLAQIHKCFEEEDIRVIFLKGMGGIGKSELARHYAARHRNIYKSVVFARYEKGKGLVSLIADDEIFSVRDIFRNTAQGESHEEYAKRKLKALKMGCGTETLIIIDNYDTEIMDEFLSLLVYDCPYRVLVTTRFDQEKRYKQISVEEISDISELKRLFVEYCGKELVRIDTQDESFSELFRLTRCHTLTLELVAMYMSENSYSLKEMVDILKKAGFEALSDSYLNHNHKNKTAYEFIKELFTLTSLSADERKFLCHMVLTAESGVPGGAFREWNPCLFIKNRTRLIKKRIVCYDSDTDMLFLHPIIRQVVLSELDVSYENCRDFLDAFTKDIDDLNYSNFSINKKKAVAWCGLEILKVLGLNEQTFEAIFESSKAFFSVMNIYDGLTQRLRLLEFANKTYGEDSVEGCKTSIQAAQAYMEYGDYQRALFMQKKNLAYLQNKADKQHELYFDLLERCCDQLGYIYMRQAKSCGKKEDFAEAERYFRMGYEAASSIEVSKKHSPELILFKHATPLLGLCSLYFENEKLSLLEESIGQFADIIDTLKCKGYSMQYDSSYLCVLQGKFSFLKKDYPKAAIAFEEAVTLRINNYTHISTTVMECYIYLAECYRELGKADLEEEKLNLAFTIAEKLYSPSHPVFSKLKAGIQSLKK